MNVELRQTKLNFARETIVGDVAPCLLLNESEIFRIAAPVLVVLLVSVSMDQLKAGIRLPKKVRVEIVDNQLAPTLVVVSSIRVVRPCEILVRSTGSNRCHNVGL